MASFKEHKANNAAKGIKNLFTPISPMDETTDRAVVFQGMLTWFHCLKDRIEMQWETIE